MSAKERTLDLSAKDLVTLIDCIATSINIKKDTLKFLQPEGKAFCLVKNGIQDMEDVLNKIKESIG